MNRQFYRIRNIPIEHPPIISEPDPVAMTHMLPKMRNLQKIIAKQIYTVSAKKQKEQTLKQSLNKAAEQSRFLQKQIKKLQQQFKRKSKEHQNQVKEKSGTIMLLFCEVQRLLKIRSVLSGQISQLHSSNSNMRRQYQLQFSKFKDQLTAKSQQQLKNLKLEFGKCIESLKLQYSEQLKIMTIKENEDVQQNTNYKEIIQILETENQIVKKQKQAYQVEIKMLKEQHREKINAITQSLENKRLEVGKLIIQNTDLEVKNKLAIEKYKRITEVKSQLEERVEQQNQLLISLELNKTTKLLDKQKSRTIEKSYRSQDKSIQYDRVQSQDQSLKAQKQQFDNYRLQFKQIQQQLKNQIKLLKEQIQFKNSQIAQLKGFLRQKEQKIYEQTEEIKQKSSISIFENQKLEKLESQNSKFKGMLHDMKRGTQKQLQSKEELVHQMQETIKLYQKQIQDLKQINQETIQQLRQKDQKHNEYIQLLQIKSSRQISADMQNYRVQLQELKVQNQNLKQQIQQIRQQNQKLKEQIGAKDSMINDLNESKFSLQKRVQELQSFRIQNTSDNFQQASRVQPNQEPDNVEQNNKEQNNNGDDDII